MASHSDLDKRIRVALAEYLRRDVDSILPEDSLRDDLGLDSMATIELLFRIEETFDFQIPDEDLQGLQTVADVIAYVDRRTATGNALRRAKPASKRLQAKKKG